MRPVRMLAFLAFASIFNPLRAQSNAAPYFAQFRTTTARALANGTTITHETTGKVARDSDGRTYTEETREAGVGDHKSGRTYVSIFDPWSASLSQSTAMTGLPRLLIFYRSRIRIQ